MTKLLYMEGSLDACYETEFQAEVTMVKPDWVMLDQTLFYPEGGGQPSDHGQLIIDGNEHNVSEVTKRGPVKHVVGGDHGLQEGDTISGTIDWERRYAHMRMHTAQHLASGLAYELFGGMRTVGNQIHAETSRIDFQPAAFTQEQLDDLKAAFDAEVKAQRPIEQQVMQREEINGILPPERTNMDLLPQSVKELRVIRIGNDVDLCPCAGTHVRNTKELGEFEVVRTKGKGKGKQRLEYKLV